MTWNSFGRSLDLSRVVLDIVHGKQNGYGYECDDVMEEFRRNGRDVDMEQEVKKLPKGRNKNFQKRKNVPQQIQGCKFCKNNGEDIKFYSTHSLRDSWGNTTCPILLRYKCTVCNVYGHTVSYCPKNGPGPKIALMNILKSTRMSNGKWRKPLM